MLIIRFARRGRKNRAFFELVVAEKRRAVQKKFVERLGYYDPHTEDGKGKFEYNAERIAHFISNGAQVSDSAAKRLKRAGMEGMEKFIAFRPQKPKKVTEVAEDKS